MTSSPRRAPRLLPLPAAVAGLALVFGACSPGTTEPPVTASPSPTPAPTATPEPVDVAAEFVRIMTDPNFSARASVSGSLDMGGLQGDVSGALVTSSGSSASELTIEVFGTSQTSSTVSTRNRTYEKTGDGPWIEQPPAERTKSLATSLAALASVTDLGVETLGGRSLHHLEPDPAFDLGAEALGLSDDAIQDAEVELDFYAEADGTPAAMVFTVTWNQVIEGGSLPVTMTMQFDFREVGQPQTIEEPSDVWTTHESRTLGYSMARPAGWTVEEEEDGTESFGGDAASLVFVANVELDPGTTLDEYAELLAADYRGEWGIDPEEVDRSVELGGAAAARLTYRVTIEGSPVIVIDTIVVRDGLGWEVFMVTEDGLGADEEIERYDQFLSTFAFLD